MSDRDLKQLPKAHLHLHLDGAMRRATLGELAARDGVQAPLPVSYGSFAAFSETIEAAARCLRSVQDVDRLMLEIGEDAVADGAVWIEPSVWPGLFDGRLGSDEHVLTAVLQAAQRASTATGVGIGVIVAANRDRGPEAALTVARLAGRYAEHGVVGFGLDGDESAAPGEWFAAAFSEARQGGLRCLPHAGELAGPHSVRTAVDVLGADRILHGVRAVEDPALLAHLVATGTALDVCPTSNVLLSVVPTWSAHPLPTLMAAGVACSLNADDPLLFDTTLLTEYTRARQDLYFDDTQLADLARTSLRHSAAPAAVVQRALADIDRWLGDPAPTASDVVSR